MSETKWLQRQEHFDWMQKCLTCWKLCEEFIAWSIQTGKYISIINACRDTAEMCSQCIKFEAQRSPFFQQLCEVCAEICERCANEMEGIKNESENFSETLSACRVFADACRQVAQKQKKEPVQQKSAQVTNKSKKTERIT